MARTAKATPDAPPPAKARRSRRAAPATLAPDIVEVMRRSSDLQRLCSRSTRNLWRERGLSERALFILELVNAGMDRPSRLIEYFGVLPSTITFETDKLAAAGLLTRDTSPADRRVVCLTLTEAGRRIHGEVCETLNALLQPRLDRVSPEALRSFLDTFAILLAPDEDTAAAEAAGAQTPAKTPPVRS